MNKSELIDAVAGETGSPKSVVGPVIDATFSAIANECSKIGGTGYTHVGFGSFKRHQRKARKGYNPKTKQPISIGASTTIKFKASGSVKHPA